MDRFERAIALIDEANAADPQGKELLRARRMSDWLNRLEPAASEALKLAVRAQHIRRWDIPRESFPLDKNGYHAWRRRLYEHHAAVAAAILRQAGYDTPTIERVGSLLRKERLKADPETQTLEDVICLVFLETEFAEFRARKDYDEAKWLNILRRTWAKMSPRGHALALALPLDDETRQLVSKAIGNQADT